MALAVAVGAPLLLSQARNLSMMQRGDDTAAALGVRLERTRILVIVAAAGQFAFDTRYPVGVVTRYADHHPGSPPDLRPG